jgi:hypothetical protein
MENPVLWQRCHKDVDLYYYGIAALLREGNVGSYPNYSGWFGKGYSLIARCRLQKEGIAPWTIRGSTVALRNVFTHKGWGETLPVGYKHLEVLVREAGRALNLNKELAPQWMLPLTALKGTKLKKKLATQQAGFLLTADLDALNQRFETDIQTYKVLESSLAKPSFELFVTVPERIATAEKAIATLESTASRIRDGRAHILYPPQQGRVKKKDKRTLKERLATIEPWVFINHFGPYAACGIAHFATSEITCLTEEGSFKNAEMTTSFQAYARRYPEWENVLISWWDSEVQTRYA